MTVTSQPQEDEDNTWHRDWTEAYRQYYRTLATSQEDNSMTTQPQPTRRSVLMDDRSIDFPDGWEDSIVVGCIRHNRDGSITISCGIYVHDDSGNGWSTNRDIRLSKDKS